MCRKGPSGIYCRKWVKGHGLPRLKVRLLRWMLLVVCLQPGRRSCRVPGCGARSPQLTPGRSWARGHPGTFLPALLLLLLQPSSSLPARVGFLMDVSVILFAGCSVFHRSQLYPDNSMSAVSNGGVIPRSDSLAGSRTAAARPLVLLVSLSVFLRPALRPDFCSFSRVITVLGRLLLPSLIDDVVQSVPLAPGPSNALGASWEFFIFETCS